MKEAQILSTIPDAIPEEYAKRLSMLQAEAPSMGWLFVKRRMRTELGINWQDKFKYFDKEAIKAACQFARTNDIILVAGKGHESYQEVKGVRSDFDDFEIVKELLNQKN